MALPLTDPRWHELQGSYGGVADILAWLTEAKATGLTRERLGDLINEVQHQGDTTTAMYAVAGHLIELATWARPQDALDMLIHADLIYARSDGPYAAPCPLFLQADFQAAATVGAQMLSPLLSLAAEFDHYKWAVAGLAGFLGHNRFARFLEDLDFYEDRFHHTLLDEPFPPES